MEVALSPERRQPGQGALRLRVWSPAGTGTQRSDLHRGTLANTDPELPTSSQIRKQLTSPRCGEEETEPCGPRHGHLLTGRGATKRPFRRGGGGDGPRLGLVGGGAALKIHEVRYLPGRGLSPPSVLPGVLGVEDACPSVQVAHGPGKARSRREPCPTRTFCDGRHRLLTFSLAGN